MAHVCKRDDTYRLEDPRIYQSHAIRWIALQTRRQTRALDHHCENDYPHAARAIRIEWVETVAQRQFA